MNSSIEHQKMVDFVDSFKAANKNTVERVRKFDPKLKTWTFEVVKRDENASKFSEELKNTKRRQREKDKRMKNNPEKKPAPAPKATEKKKQPSNKVMPVKPRSEMRMNVVRLRKEGKTFIEIGKLYGVSATSARSAHHREIHDK